MLQINVNTTVENARLADVGLVCADRGIEGNKRNVAALTLQGRDERIVAHAASAVHPTGAGGEIGDFHPRRRRRNASGTASARTLLARSIAPQSTGCVLRFTSKFDSTWQV